ncbi:hypothetical protein J2S49_000335 [Arcanobacterium wilhelmae]|uniref:DUF3040 domain-containing protein n=1 Tax=Arcanobacterium wilhelmae TaxID=1803177 RepID=A0ABT9N973_9ACTO|nr:DUF3040 domain-containing protein [Arcanobacterium wilhelmae]MDP9800259.1 hypothetical protein [Arcanobacterium wilhelmae]WFN89698.1 DUF3040 domain-containing protein [Arcanobacterium wilhelmae]
MALSDREREMLEELEAQLKGEDPKFADALRSDTRGVPTRMVISPRHLVLGIIIAAIGLGVVVLGVSTEITLVGVAGAIVVFAGLWYLSTGARNVPVSVSARKPKQRSTSFMEAQAEQWRRRREEGGR